MAAKLRARIAASDIHAEIIGPAPCFYAKVRGYYRWQIVLRSTHPEALLPEKLAEAWTLDIDPVSLL
jgi:primosomal protein N' (replication factor Y)